MYVCVYADVHKEKTENRKPKLSHYILHDSRNMENAETS